ncbi:MAG: 7-cyano-7-deazaguanine synthase [Gemmatimonadota bacterium]
MKPAVVLLSGGLDSTTALAVAISAGYAPYALSFRHGQRNVFALQAAGRVARSAKVRRHLVAAFDLRMFGGAAPNRFLPDRRIGHRRRQREHEAWNSRNVAGCRIGSARLCRIEQNAALPVREVPERFLLDNYICNNTLQGLTVD